LVTDRRLKIVFYVSDADTGERVCETQQCVLKFDGAELERKIDKIRSDLTDATPAQLDEVAATARNIWVREIIDSGFLAVAVYAKNACLRHLGYDR
jgi:hypothetical protein